ncbi:hypothetical protein BU15DRAFT_67583 [Melanogaster broomeanus]|nr:hypothetical protein BU15DRAFT_67583 [Melanogaster broomeanus]
MEWLFKIQAASCASQVMRQRVDSYPQHILRVFLRFGVAAIVFCGAVREYECPWSKSSHRVSPSTRRFGSKYSPINVYGDPGRMSRKNGLAGLWSDKNNIEHDLRCRPRNGLVFPMGANVWPVMNSCSSLYVVSSMRGWPGGWPSVSTILHKLSYFDGNSNDVLTFSNEVEYIWNRPWTLVSMMYLVLRYLGLLVAMVQAFSTAMFLFMVWGGSIFGIVTHFLPIIATRDNHTMMTSVMFILLIDAEVINMELCIPSYNVGTELSLYIYVCSTAISVVLCSFAIVQFIRHSLGMHKALGKWQSNRYMKLLVQESILYFMAILLRSVLAWMVGSSTVFSGTAQLVLGVPVAITKIAKLRYFPIRDRSSGGGVPPRREALCVISSSIACACVHINSIMFEVVYNDTIVYSKLSSESNSPSSSVSSPSSESSCPSLVLSESERS